MYKSILVPLDGSACAQKALALACYLTRASQATLYLLNVPEKPPATDTRVGATSLDYTPEEAQQHGRDVIEKALESIDVDMDEGQVLVRQGAPAHVIIEEAKRLGVDTIIMGSRGLSNLRGLTIGSVSHKVSHVAPCTVIMVH